MLDVGRFVSTLVLLCGLVSWAIFVVGCGVALSETVYIVDNSTTIKFYFKCSGVLLITPMIPVFALSAVSYPVTVVAAMIDLYLSLRKENRGLWCFTTATTTVAGSIFLLSAGMSILITGFGAFIISYLAHHNKVGGFNLAIILGRIITSDTLWAANLSAIIGIILATLFYLLHSWYWPHTLKQRRNHSIPFDLLQVSTDK